MARRLNMIGKLMELGIRNLRIEVARRAQKWKTLDNFTSG